MATDRIRRCNEARPYRGGCTLRNGFILKGRSLFTCGDARLYLRAQFRRHMAAKLGLDPARMQRGRANAASLEPVVERDRIENVRGLGTAVAEKGLVLGPLEIWIVEVDVANLMTSGG